MLFYIFLIPFKTLKVFQYYFYKEQGSQYIQYRAGNLWFPYSIYPLSYRAGKIESKIEISTAKDEENNKRNNTKKLVFRAPPFSKSDYYYTYYNAANNNKTKDKQNSFPIKHSFLLFINLFINVRPID